MPSQVCKNPWQCGAELDWQQTYPAGFAIVAVIQLINSKYNFIRMRQDLFHNWGNRRCGSQICVIIPIIWLKDYSFICF